MVHKGTAHGAERAQDLYRERLEADHGSTAQLLRHAAAVAVQPVAVHERAFAQRKVIFCEESEKGMIELFNDQGFDCITLPFRNVFEFGGSFHCVTTDIRRRGQMKSYFKALDAADAAAAEP